MLGLLIEFKNTILALFRTFGTAADGMSLEDFQRFAKRQHLCPRFIRPTELQKVWRDPREGGDEGTAECMDKKWVTVGIKMCIKMRTYQKQPVVRVKRKGAREVCLQADERIELIGSAG